MDPDPDLVASATETIQGLERLKLQLRTKSDSNPELGNVYPDACKALDDLREVKSKIEQTAVTFEAVKVKESVLVELRTHILMHVPGTLTEDVKKRMKDLVIRAFDGTCREVLFAGLVTCPWYWATQDDRGLQAKHNSVFVVYVNKDDQFFAPVNPHQKEKDSEVIDEGWFYGAEAYHFANYLVKGKARFIETLFLPESAVFCAEEQWLSLKQNLGSQICLGLRGFLEQCRGQAVGTVAKKSKSTGRMKLKDGATLYEFCEGYRLLHHASQALSNNELHLGSLGDTTLPGAVADEALAVLKQSYSVDTCDRVKLFDILMRWREEVDKQMKRKFTAPEEIEKILASWLIEVRTQGNAIPRPLAIDPSAKATLRDLMEKIGGPVVKMDPENIILIVQAGSVLYGLNTPDSDVDYLIVYADPIEKVLGTCKRLTESVENRGPEKSFEYGAYEVRLLCEMLWKGSVVMLELLFADEVQYGSKMWEILVSNKEVFMTEHAILQYFGLIRNNMTDIEHKRFIDTPREKKLFYQILHKLYCLEFFLRSECPKIKCEGATREFIMKVRRGPLEGDISRDNLYKLCREKTEAMREALSQRKRRLPENTCYSFLSKWLKTVRGWNASESGTIAQSAAASSTDS